MTNFFQLLRKNIVGLDRYPAFLLAAWLLVMMSLPLLNIIFGRPTLLQGLALAVLLQVAFVLNVLYKAWGWWSMLRASMGVALLTWAVQAIVIRSGLPYGNLQYTSSLQPHLLGIPVLIPLTWLMMLPPAWAIAKLITHKLTGCLMRLVFIMVSAFAFTAWAVYFDPFLVRQGTMQWSPLGDFYGIPWWNFLGVLFISGLITFALSPKRLPGGLLVLVYGLTWMVEFISLLIFGGLLLPAVIGFLLMGGMLLAAAMITR